MQAADGFQALPVAAGQREGGGSVGWVAPTGRGLLRPSGVCTGLEARTPSSGSLSASGEEDTHTETEKQRQSQGEVDTPEQP